MEQFGQFINGQWTDFTPEASFVSQSPASGEVLAAFSKGTRADVLAAVDAAEGAFPQWKSLPAPKRGEILLRAAQILRDRKEELGRLVSQEMGKVIAEGRGDVQEAIDFLEYIAGEGRRLFGETTTSELQSKFAMTIRQPIGVVGCITPWNFPIAIPAWKLGAALVAGNTVVFKPASQTPLCATRLVEVLTEAGVPAGVQQRTTLEYIEIGKAEGARLVYGGKKPDPEAYGGGFFVEPTIFEAEHGMRITKEEIFGPVLSVIKFSDYDQAVRIANDVDYGLSSSIYTSNVNLTFRAIQDLEAGITYVNAPTIGAEVHLPFGGIKNTGNGGREAGTTAIQEFTEIKTVFVDFSGTLQRAQIDECCP